MAKSIEPRLRKIKDYLKLEKDVYFSIPEYQRAYSWEINYCDKLWQDILEFAESDGSDRYFFGTIIINCQNNDTNFALIDGQQRTTTFLLMLKALLMNINNAIINTCDDEESAGLLRGLKERRNDIIKILYRADVEDIPDIPNQEKEQVIYNRPLLIKNYSINERYADELRKIVQAVDFESAEKTAYQFKGKQRDNRYTRFFRNFKYFYNKAEELSISQLNKITKTILESCEVIEIKSWQVEQAIKMFNSLNSDALPLNDSDIISAKLYAEAEKMNRQEEFGRLWEYLYDLVEDLYKQHNISLNALLMQYMYYLRAINRDIVNDNGNINVTMPGLRRYFVDINKEPIKDPIKMCNDLINLAKIWDRVCELEKMKVLLKFNENAKLFLASYLMRFSKFEEIELDKLNLVIESMLRLFSLLEIENYGYSNKYFKMFLFGEELKLADKNISEYEIKNDFDTHIHNNWKQSYIVKAINEYDANTLVYLNELLFARENNKTFVLGSLYDIEHIMPYSGKDLQEIRKDAEIDSIEEFRGIVNKLGNKILLERKINRSIGNEWFRTKISTRLIDKTGYLDSIYPIANYLVKKYMNSDKPYWNKNDIIDATQKASERISNFIFLG